MKILLVLVLIVALAAPGCAQPGPPPPRNDARPQVGGTEVFVRGLSRPSGLTFAHGYLYVVNRGTGSISKISPEAEVEQFVDLDRPEAFCLVPTPDQDGFYVTAGDVIYLVSMDGQASVFADGFTLADDLTLDQEGNIYVTDARENKVYRLSPDGQREVFIENNLDTLLPDQWYAVGIAFSHDYQWLYVVNMYLGQITKHPILADGTAGPGEVVYLGDGEPDHITLDARGNLYVTLFRDSAVMKITPDNEHKIFASTNLYNPTGIAFGGEGFNPDYLYVSSQGLRTVTRVYVGSGD